MAQHLPRLPRPRARVRREPHRAREDGDRHDDAEPVASDAKATSLARSQAEWPATSNTKLRLYSAFAAFLPGRLTLGSRRAADDHLSVYHQPPLRLVPPVGGQRFWLHLFGEENGQERYVS